MRHGAICLFEVSRTTGWYAATGDGSVSAVVEANDANGQQEDRNGFRRNVKRGKLEDTMGDRTECAEDACPERRAGSSLCAADSP